MKFARDETESLGWHGRQLEIVPARVVITLRSQVVDANRPTVRTVKLEVDDQC